MSFDRTHLKQLAINDNGFVFDPRTGHTFTLNATGVAVLEALKKGDPLPDIVARLSADYDLDGSEDVARDLEDFVATLRQFALVSRDDEDASA